jgi:LPXTG-motif cell wall-anchored protein
LVTLIRRPKSRKLGAVVLAAGALLMLVGILFAATGVAQEPLIVIPIDTVVTGEPGSIHVLATASVPEEFHGVASTVSATSENQSSVHPGSNLTIASDGESVVLLDVEADPGGTVTASGTLTLNPEIVVSLTLGPDGVFSGGVTVTITPLAQPSPSPTPTDETSPSPSPTPPSPTTTAGAQVLAGQITTPTPAPVQVAGARILPVTGPISSWTIFLIGMSFILGGVILVFGQRHYRPRRRH